MQQIYAGIKYRKKYAYEEKWDMWRNFYRGLWKPGVLPKNIYFKTLRTLVPRVYYRNPSVSIIPAMPGYDNMLLAKILQRADNKLMVRMGVKEQMKRIVQNGIMFGTGVGKLGFGAEFTPTPDMLGTESPQGGSSKNPKHLEYNDLISANNPWFLSVHTGKFIVPVGAQDIHSARWVAHWERRPLYDVQEDSRLKNTGALKSGTTSFTEKLQGEDPGDLVDIVEVRDKKTQRVMLLAPHGEPDKRVLYDEDDDLQVDGGVPYYPLIFNQDDKVFWGVPDSQIIEPMQLEANEIRTLIMRHRRVTIAKILAKKGAITPDEEDKLVSAEVKAVVEVDGELADVREMPPQPIPAGLIQSEQMTDQEVQEILGLGVNQFGEYAKGSADRSATEANIVNQATQIRVDERRDAAADMLVNMTSDMHHVMFERWSGEQVIDIVGPAGLQIWVKFKPEMLKSGRYEVKVDPDSSLPETKQLREQKAVQTYGLLKQNPLINPVALTQFLLNSLYGVQFDSLMIKQISETSPQNPMDFGQLQQVMQQMQAQMPNANLIE